MGIGTAARRFGALGATVLVLAVACSSGDGGSDGGSDGAAGDDPAVDATTVVTTEGDEVVTFEGRVPDEIAPPPAEGEGIVLPQPAAPVPEGWIVEEHLVGGTATSFRADETPADGHWSATPDDEAEYRTRVIVRRPAAPEDFSGTVVVEWFNVSAIEASPDWAFLAEELVREGHAYIGVSAQAQGVEGGDTLLDVEVDADDALAQGVATDPSGLKHLDPERYGTLVHPGDAYAFDIFGQVGRAAIESSDQLLGGLRPTQVLAAGESQSAIFLSTFANAVQPLDPVFDGFLIHSRGANVAPLDGDFVSAREAGSADELRSQAVRIRTNLDVPVVLFETETDLTLLGFAHARQPDSDLVHTWEVAGLAHADAHFVRAIVGGPRDPGVGELLGCTTPINTGPQKEVLQAAFHHLVTWAAGGDRPPTGAPLELEDGDDGTVVIARDADGIARGGVRHPLVDVPTATLSGDPPGGGSIDDLAGGADLCILFGSTTPFEREALVERYGTFDDYLAAFTAAADEAVTAGFLLRPDADALVAEAEANRELFG